MKNEQVTDEVSNWLEQQDYTANELLQRVMDNWKAVKELIE